MAGRTAASGSPQRTPGRVRPYRANRNPGVQHPVHGARTSGGVRRPHAVHQRDLDELSHEAARDAARPRRRDIRPAAEIQRSRHAATARAPEPRLPRRDPQAAAGNAGESTAGGAAAAPSARTSSCCRFARYASSHRIVRSHAHFRGVQESSRISQCSATAGSRRSNDLTGRCTACRRTRSAVSRERRTRSAADCGAHGGGIGDRCASGHLGDTDTARARRIRPDPR